MQGLLARLDDRSAIVGVMGLGYVGRPMAAAVAAGGFRVLGFELDQARLERLDGDRSWLGAVPAGRVGLTSDMSRLAEADAVLVCVPTPLDADRQPDLSQVSGAARAIARGLRPGQLIVLESTTWPGTTREVVLPLLEAGGLRCGRDFALAYAPEREDPGRSAPGTRAIPRLVGGIDDRSRDVAARLYGAVLDQVVCVSSAEVAEAAKLLENVYRSVNIALVNEAKTLFTAMGIDVREVLDAAATKPFGYQRFDPGPGLGGHCIPVDPFYLAWKARQVGGQARLVELAGEINRSMPTWVIERTVQALAERGRPVRGASILVLGVAYKRDVADVRESPGLALMQGLSALGATVAYHDPHVPALPAARDGAVCRSVPLDAARLERTDCVILVTDHSSLDLDLLAHSARLVVDTRGALRGRPGADVVDA